MASVSSLITILRRVFSDAVDPVVVFSDAMQYWSQALDTFLQERDRLPRKRVCDLDFLDLRRDPIAAIQRIYQHFGWLLSPEAEERMRVVLANQPGNNTAIIGIIYRSLVMMQRKVAERSRAIANGSVSPLHTLLANLVNATRHSL
jgi:hypothetical protein